MLARPTRRAKTVAGGGWTSHRGSGYAVLSGLRAIAMAGMGERARPSCSAGRRRVPRLPGAAVLTLALALELGSRDRGRGGDCRAVRSAGSWVLGNIAVASRPLPLECLGDTVRSYSDNGLWRAVIDGLEPPARLVATMGRGGEAMWGTRLCGCAAAARVDQPGRGLGRARVLGGSR